MGSVPGSGRAPGGGNDYPLQYSCLENSMDRRAWWATAHGVTKSQTQLTDQTTTAISYSITFMPPLLSHSMWGAWWRNQDSPSLLNLASLTTSWPQLLESWFPKQVWRKLGQFFSCKARKHHGEGNGNPLWYSCLGNPTDRGAWWATAHGVTKSQAQLKQLSTHTPLTQ